MLWYFHLHSKNQSDPYVTLLSAEGTEIFVKHVDYTKAQYTENNYYVFAIIIIVLSGDYLIIESHTQFLEYKNGPEDRMWL